LKFRAVPEFTPAAAAARARARAMMAQAGRRGPAGGGRKAKEA
jgi:hypothetical protein